MRQLRIVQAVIFNGVTPRERLQKDYDADTKARYSWSSEHHCAAY